MTEPSQLTHAWTAQQLTGIKSCLKVEPDSFPWHGCAGAKIVNPYGPATNRDTGWRKAYQDLSINCRYAVKIPNGQLSENPTYPIHGTLEKAALVVMDQIYDDAVAEYAASRKPEEPANIAEGLAELIKRKIEKVNSLTILDEAANMFQYAEWHLNHSNQALSAYGMLLSINIMGYSGRKDYYSTDINKRISATTLELQEYKKILIAARSAAIGRDEDLQHAPPETPSWWTDTNIWDGQCKGLTTFKEDRWIERGIRMSDNKRSGTFKVREMIKGMRPTDSSPTAAPA
jgi:hypothetical protein